MGLNELIALLNNRLAYVASQRSEAFARGDLALTTTLDADIAKTTETLAILQNVK